MLTAPLRRVKAWGLKPEPPSHASDSLRHNRVEGHILHCAMAAKPLSPSAEELAQMVLSPAADKVYWPPDRVAASHSLVLGEIGANFWGLKGHGGNTINRTERPRSRVSAR